MLDEDKSDADVTPEDVGPLDITVGGFKPLVAIDLSCEAVDVGYECDRPDVQ